jgi:hypothetical protein
MLEWLKRLCGHPTPKPQGMSNATKLRLLAANNIAYTIDGQNVIWVEGAMGQWYICPDDFLKFESNEQD